MRNVKRAILIIYAFIFMMTEIKPKEVHATSVVVGGATVVVTGAVVEYFYTLLKGYDNDVQMFQVVEDWQNAVDRAWVVQAKRTIGSVMISYAVTQTWWTMLLPEEKTWSPVSDGNGQKGICYNDITFVGIDKNGDTFVINPTILEYLNKTGQLDNFINLCNTLSMASIGSLTALNNLVKDNTSEQSTQVARQSAKYMKAMGYMVQCAMTSLYMENNKNYVPTDITQAEYDSLLADDKFMIVKPLIDIYVNEYDGYLITKNTKGNYQAYFSNGGISISAGYYGKTVILTGDSRIIQQTPSTVLNDVYDGVGTGLGDSYVFSDDVVFRSVPDVYIDTVYSGHIYPWTIDNDGIVDTPFDAYPFVLGIETGVGLALPNTSIDNWTKDDVQAILGTPDDALTYDDSIVIDSSESIDGVLDTTQEVGWLRKIWDLIKSIPQMIFNLIKGLIQAIIDLLTLIWNVLRTLVSTLLDGLSSLLQFLFVPSGDIITDNIVSMQQRFPFVDSIVDTVNQFKSQLDGLDYSVAPVVYADFSQGEGVIAFNQQVPVLDLRWYARYKPFVDVILSTFLWVVFCWRVYTHLPSIISGVSSSVDTLSSKGGNKDDN